MAITVRNAVLWRNEVENKAGVLASVLKPFADAGVDLQVVMGYRYPGNEAKGAIEVFPVKENKTVAAAAAAGLKASSIPTLIVEGDNKPGLGYTIAQAIAESGISLAFLFAQVIGGRFSAILGFESEADSGTAATLIEEAIAGGGRG